LKYQKHCITDIYIYIYICTKLIYTSNIHTEYLITDIISEEKIQWDYISEARGTRDWSKLSNPLVWKIGERCFTQLGAIQFALLNLNGLSEPQILHAVQQAMGHLLDS
jgi:hypothetical protein